MNFFLEIVTRVEFIVAVVVIVGGTLAILLVQRRKARAARADQRPALQPVPVPTADDEHVAVPVASADHPRVTFADVAGLDDAIAELQEVSEYLADPDRFRRLGAELPKGILLHGQPGCGKTLLARALAGETGVPFFSVSASSFVEKYVGVGAARIRKLFEQAKAAAPSIIFIDELDALGSRSSSEAQGEREFDHCLNQLLVEMDGFAGTAGVLVVGATNRPELVDPALIRPGRFNRSIAIDRLDRDGREQALLLHAGKRRVSRNVDWTEVANQTAGLSAADLANLVNEAALLAARRHHPLVSADDVEEAITRVHAGLRRPRMLSEEEKEIVAVHEAGHALLSLLLRGAKPPARVSIVSRSGAMGKSLWATDDDQMILTKRQLLAQLILLLGGRAAELNTFGEPSTRAEDDLEQAAAVGRRMVERWAMTGRFELAGGKKDSVARQFEGSAGGQEVRQLLAQAERAARVILGDHAGRLRLIAGALLERETLTAAELDELGRGVPLTQGVPEPVRRPLRLRGA
ncbi:MAG TPA: AAA family ATPase [Egibacteraceae bacterium]|nr:AAA family ATPase [Egibacteraceae bacterium]